MQRAPTLPSGRTREPSALRPSPRTPDWDWDSSFTWARLLSSLLVVATVAAAMGFVFSPKHLGGVGSSAHPDKLFNFHPLLNFFAFLCLSVGVMSWKIFPNWTHRQRKSVHGVLNTAGLILILTSTAIVVRWHALLDSEHFYSVHSWLGLMTIVVASAQWLGGFCGFGLAVVGDEWKATLLPVHKFLGTLVYILLLSLLMLGLLNWQRTNPQDNFSPTKLYANCLAVITALSGASVLFWLSATSPAAPAVARPVYERIEDDLTE